MKTSHRRAAQGKRRARHQRWAADPTILARLTDRQTLTTEEQTRITLPVHLAFAAIGNGTGTDADLGTLGVALNITAIALEGVQLCEQPIAAAQQALLRCAARKQTHGCYGWDGPGREAMREAIDLHDQLLTHAAPAHTEAWIGQCRARVARGEGVMEVQPA